VPFEESTESPTRSVTVASSAFDLPLQQLRSLLDAQEPAAQRHDPLRAGEVIAGRYRITRLIGRGGMGEVYAAHDLLLKEAVAIKTVRADRVQHQSLVERFEEEVHLARLVTHPNVCRIYEVGVHAATPPPDARAPGNDSGRAPLLFFAMELLEGQTLAARIRARPLTRAEAFPIAVQLAEGLQAAHRAGVIHADFKSANVILVPSPGGVRAVITDFGVARLDPSRVAAEDAPTMADEGRAAGTVAYMSPEQLAGDRITAASDLYSFGIVLFEMASGTRPFDDRVGVTAAGRRASGDPVSVRARVPDIDPRWDAAIRRCLQQDPTRRFASAGELAAWFRGGAWRPLRYWTRHDWVRHLAVASLLVAAGVTGWMWTTRPYRPLPAAQPFYEAGVNALHSMTYETARKALERTVAIDPTFALAHASLARAYDELDYTDRAKDSMLRAVAAARDSRLTRADERQLRAMQFVVSRDYERALPFMRQIEADAVNAEPAGRQASAAALESGWLAQQMDDSAEAAAAFQRALTLDPSYAAAKLRLGYMFGRRGGPNDLALALEAFTDAEQLHASAGDYEGVTQTLLERANLLDRRSREQEALPVIEKAVAVARLVGNRYQEIRLHLMQGNAYRDLGDTTRAAALVRGAIEMATAENMDNLVTSGLIDLGNVHLVERDLEAAASTFGRALDSAQRARVRRAEARARAALGSLYEQDHRPATAKPLIEASLAFYRNAGYRRESIQAAIVLGGVLRQLGENGDGIRILRETLPFAVSLQDRRAEAQLRERIADSLRDQSEWPAALAEYQRAIALAGSVVQAEQLRVKSAGLQWRLGQRQNAEASLQQSERFGVDSRNPSLLASIQAQRAEIALAGGRLDEAMGLVRRAMAGQRGDDDASRQWALLGARVRIEMKQHDGLVPASSAVEAMERAGLTTDAALARLSIAEALLTAGDTGRARSLAEAAVAYLEPKHVWEAVWRGHVIVARASAERADVDAHDAAARSALTHLNTAWGATAVDRYLRRPGVERLARGMHLSGT
jgi:serine/threonine protein kinase